MTFFPPVVPVGRYSLFHRSTSRPVAYSLRRDIISTVGTGSVSTSGTELRLQTAAVASDEAKCWSNERGELRGGDDYIEYALSVRVPTAPTGNQEAFWGAFDDNYGIGFGQDATDYFIFTRRSTTTTKIYQSSWNQNTLSSLDATDHYEYRVRVPHFSYGGAEFYIREFDSGGNVLDHLVHKLAGVSGAVDSLPHLPIGGAVDNGSTATALNLYLGDRWCAYQGPGRNRNQRIYGQFFINRSPTTTQAVYQSLRKRSGAKNQAVNVRLYDMEIISDLDILCELHVNAGLTSPTWEDIPDTSEAVVERDISASAFTAGDIVYGCQAAANSFNKWEFTPNLLVFEGSDPISVVARTTTGSSSAGTHFGLRVIEEW